jgi:hypothetical protein
MGLLKDEIAAHGGMSRWHARQHFSVRASIDGTLFTRKGRDCEGDKVPGRP